MKGLAGLGIGAAGLAGRPGGAQTIPDGQVDSPLAPPEPRLTIPEVVRYENHPERLLGWTALPPIRIDAAQLVISTGEVLEWEVVDRVRNFTVVRTTSNAGFQRYTSYAGIQPLNAAWFRAGGTGTREVLSIRDLDTTAPTEDAEAIDGVDPVELAFTLRLESRTEDGRESRIFTRRVIRAEAIQVEINKRLYVLRAVEVELETFSRESNVATLGRSFYVPTLGIGIQGRYVEPAAADWSFAGIRVNPLVQRDVEDNALRREEEDDEAAADG